MRKPRIGTTDLIRLPLDVAQAIRLRAARADLTLAAAARQLLVEKAEGHPLDFPQQVRWLSDQLSERRHELAQVLEDFSEDPILVDQAIQALNALTAAWPGEGETPRGLRGDPATL